MQQNCNQPAVQETDPGALQKVRQLMLYFVFCDKQRKGKKILYKKVIDTGEIRTHAGRPQQIPRIVQFESAALTARPRCHVSDQRKIEIYRLDTCQCSWMNARST